MLLIQNPIPSEEEIYISFLRVMNLNAEIGVFVRTAALSSIFTSAFVWYTVREKFLIKSHNRGNFEKCLAKLIVISTLCHSITLSLMILVNALIDRGCKFSLLVYFSIHLWTHRYINKLLKLHILIKRQKKIAKTFAVLHFFFSF